MDARMGRSGRAQRALALVVALWLALYGSHALHLVPGTEHAGAAMAAMADHADAAAAGLDPLAHCLVEAVTGSGAPWLVLAIVSGFGLDIASAPRAVAGPTQVLACEARAGPGKRLALLQVFRN
jgi:hypothetical protein